MSDQAEIWIDLFDHDIKLDATIIYQEAELPDAQYPGCDASTEVSELVVAERDESFTITKEEIKEMYEKHCEGDEKGGKMLVELDYVTMIINQNGTLDIDEFADSITDLLDH